MASLRPLDIVARFTAETRDFERATRDMDGDLRTLDRAYDRSAQSSKDWSRTVDRSADDAADGLTHAKARFGEAGSEVGAEFAENVGEAFRSGDYVGALAETFTSLTPALGAIGLAVGAAVGIGKGVLDSMNADRERIKQAGRDMFEAARDGMLEASEREQALTTALGVESVSDALDEVNRRAQALNVDPVKLLHRLLYPEQSMPGLDRVIARAADYTADLTQATGEAKVAAQDQKTEAQAVRDLLADQLELQRSSKAKVDEINGAYSTTLEYVRRINREIAAGYGAGSSTYRSQVPRAAGRVG